MGANLEGDQLKNLTNLLGKNLDLFAWTIQDVPEIDPMFISQRLSLDKGVKPIAQARRKLNVEKAEAAKVKMEKLL